MDKSKLKQNVHEKSVIDYIIIDSFLCNDIIKMKIDEEKEFCPFSTRKTKKDTT